ncbi:hypothetical protein [Marinicellulosiphila megalodicopiae]|uniref:hypothetical protein n=1 Tax=Marinicellulosiphila megalodicopiae TaxID=2724896 RepID=UPI003BB1F3A6
MNHYPETELLNELIKIQEQIELCFDMKQWSQVESIDTHCRSVLEKVNEFAKTGASVMLKLQVEALIKSYRELLTQSIFEQNALKDKHDQLAKQHEFTDLVKSELTPQMSVQ